MEIGKPMATKSALAKLLFVLCFFSPLWAPAHEMRPAMLEIQEVGEGDYKVSWKVPARGDEHLLLTPILDGEPVFKAQSSRFLNGAYIENGRFTRSGGLVGTSLSIEGLNETFTDVLLRVEDKDGGVISARLSPQTPFYKFEDEVDGWSLVRTYIGLGIRHILLGIDHLLFVACIVLITGFSRRLFWVITGFSIAHSITLGLSALGMVSVPVPVVEAVIALSIVFMAREIIKNDTTTLTFRRPVVVSCGFGLLHGFGFAAVLTEVGLPRGENLLALLCFNVGVEIGQLLFIAALFFVFFLFEKVRVISFSLIKKVAVYGVGSVGCLWVIERVLVF